MENLNLVLTTVTHNGNVKFPIIEDTNFLNTSIDELDLDTRSSNALHRAKYKTIQSVLDNLDKFHMLRGCGSKSKNKILYKICYYYYSGLTEAKKKEYLMKIIELNTK